MNAIFLNKLSWLCQRSRASAARPVLTPAACGLFVMPIAQSLLIIGMALLAASVCFSAPAQFSPLREAAPPPPSDTVIGKAKTWRPPQAVEVKDQVSGWLMKNVSPAAERSKALAIINGAGDRATGSELLDRLAEALAAVDPKVAQLVEVCSHPRSSTADAAMAAVKSAKAETGPAAVLPTPGGGWLTDAKTPTLVAANMRLYFGRWLVQGEWYEEALEQLGSLKTADVVAPAELLFYQGVCYHRTLNKDEGLKVINQLLDGGDAVPRRYVAVAYLMQADLVSLEKDSLDEIARYQEIIGKKLDQGRAGPKVRKVEKDVIDKLDKIIKKIEEEENKNQNPSDTLRPSRPANDSVPSGGKAPGDVTKKDIGHKSGWGNLPPKEREEALQQMGRDFPSHYRDAIEEYFRNLAAEEGSVDEDK
jgi:hypothetical protein